MKLTLARDGGTRGQRDVPKFSRGLRLNCTSTVLAHPFIPHRRIAMKGLALAFAVLVTIFFGVFVALSVRGQRLFGACAGCHSLQPDQNMTGPSLAGAWNRKAGSLASFTRYSLALQSANIVWNDKTLDDWITDPQHLVPGNQMTFDGIKDARQRADLLAFLKQATQPGASVAQQGGNMGSMGAMMGGGQVPNLKALDPADLCRKSATAKIPTQSLQPMDTRASFGSAISA
jgi:cytochrome c2